MTIVPMKELKDTAGISAKCHALDEPIHVTKNGYDNLVIMSSRTFEQYDRAMRIVAQRELARQRYFDELVSDIENGFEEIDAGKGKDAFESLAEMRKKNGL